VTKLIHISALAIKADIHKFGRHFFPGAKTDLLFRQRRENKHVPTEGLRLRRERSEILQDLRPLLLFSLSKRAFDRRNVFFY
jgi:hypothetical protein